MGEVPRVTVHVCSRFLRSAVKLQTAKRKLEKLSISLWAQKGLKGIPELDSW